MPQKIVTQSSAVRRALYDAGDVRHDKGNTLLHENDPQIREQCGKVVISDLGLRTADHTEQC